MTTPAVGDNILSVPAGNVDGKQIPVAVPTGIPKVGDTVTLIPTGGGQTKYAAAVTTTPAVGDTVALVPLQGGSQIKWAAVNGGKGVRDPTPGALPSYQGNLVMGVPFPIDVATDNAGNVYVLDSGSYSGARGRYSPSRVLKYSSAGKLLTTWNTAAAGRECFEPYGIAVDGAGTVYVSDLTLYRIVKFTSDGTLIGALVLGPDNWGYGWQPARAGISSDGTIFASINGYPGYYVGKISPSGTKLANWSGKGTISGDNTGPLGIAVNTSDEVIVMYPERNVIQVFNSNGDLLREWPCSGDALAVGPAGNVYVVDTHAFRVRVFTSSGSVVTEWGSQGSGVNQFGWPMGIAVDRFGSIYVADPGTGRVMKYGGWSIQITPPVISTRDPFKIMVLPVGVADRVTIAEALAGIPAGVWSFTYSTTAAPGTDWITSGGIPWPVRDCALCIGALAEFLGADAVGGSAPHRSGLLMLVEPVADLTQRIWHELLHNVSGIESADTMHSSAGFVTWMTTNHPTHPFLAGPAGYSDTTEILLLWDEYLTGTIPGITRT